MGGGAKHTLTPPTYFQGVKTPNPQDPCPCRKPRLETQVESYVYIVQRQVFWTLSQIAKHNVDLAEMVVEVDVFPRMLTSLKDADEYVKKNTATLFREIIKHTPEVSDACVKEADSFTVNSVIFLLQFLYLANIQPYSLQ